MDELLRELRRAAVAAELAATHGGLEIIKSWSADELLLADERARVYWWPSGRAVTVVKEMDRNGGALATWLASMGRDGFGRERALRRLSSDRESAAAALIALRVGDPVETIRTLAWSALKLRLDPNAASCIGPVLLRLSRRLRAAGAITAYAAMFEERNRRPLSAVLLDHPDRDLRRWAFKEAIRSGGIGQREAVQRLQVEPDQWVAHELAASVSRSGDVIVTLELLTSRHAGARAVALGSLSEEALANDAIEAALFDRAATVRRVARDRASRRGIDAMELYRRRWEERHDPRALSGAAESGAGFSLDELRGYVRDASPRIRATAADLLQRDDLTAEDVQTLFALVDDPEPAPASRAVRTLSGLDSMWAYATAAELWGTAGVEKRRRLWRLLSRRGGWDRVRADLLAAADPDPQVSDLGRLDLEAWSEYRAARMWRKPTEEQHRDIAVNLSAAGLSGKLRKAIEFRIGRA